MWVAEGMARGGVDLDELARCAPALFDQMMHAPDTLATDDQLELLSECARISGDVNFGLHLADHLELTSIGTYGYLLLNAPTLGEFLELAARYYPLIEQAGALALSTSGAVSHYRYTFTKPARLDPRHLNEWTIGYFAKFMRSKIHESWTPRSASFANAKPDDLDELRGIFGDELEFDAKVTGIDFDSAMLELPITSADPILLRIICRHADDLIQELGTKRPFRALVRLMIMEGLEHDEAKAESIARKLNMSLSSFKRRMQEDHLDFRKLREGIVKDLSEHALTETSLPLKHIALKMGYSELSAFTRAFTRLTHMPPLAYRRSARRPEAARNLSRQSRRRRTA
jgi:AraC-like DNA-binding protein